MTVIDCRTLFPRMLSLVSGSISPSELNAGAEDTIVILGRNFTSGSVVSFNTADVTISTQRFVSSTQIEVDVSVAEDATIGAFELSVTKSSGDSSSSTFTINILPNPITLDDCTLWQQSLPANLVYGGSYTLTAACKQYWQLASDINPGTSDFSCEAWFNANTFTSARSILNTYDSSAGGFYFGLYGGQPYVVIKDSDGTTLDGAVGAVLSTGTWYHMVFNFDRDDVCTVYINGASYGTVNISTAEKTLTSTRKLVGAESPIASFFDGSLALLRYRTRLMTPAEITSSYNSGNGKTYNSLTAAEQTGVVHAWDCLDQAGASTTTLRDEVGTNHGTQTNAAIISGSTLNGNFETRTGREWASFVATDKAHLECADNAALDLGTGDFWLTASVYRTTTGNQVIYSKYEDSNNYWDLECSNSDYIDFWAYVGGVQKIGIQSQTTKLTTLNTPYHIAVLVDRSNSANTRIYVNGVSQSFLSNVVSEDNVDNVGKVYIGQWGDGTFYFNGRTSQVGIGKPADASAAAVVTAAGTTNYNSGLGQYYGEISAADRTTLGITAYWDLTDGPYTSTRTANDFVGTNDLTFVAGELVTNGTFTEADDTSPPTGWTNHATYTWDTCKVASNAMSLVQDGDGAPTWCSALQAQPLTSGRGYKIGYVATRNSGTGTLYVVYESSLMGDGAGYVGTHTGTTTVSASAFTPTASSKNLNFYSQNNAANNWTIDNVSITAASIPCVSDTDVFGSWTETTAGTSTINDETVAPYAGSHAVRLDVDGSGSMAAVDQNVCTAGKTFTAVAVIKSSGPTAEMRFAFGDTVVDKAVTSTYTEYTQTSACTGNTRFRLSRHPTYVSQSIYIDNVTLTCTSPIPNGNGPSSAIASDSIGTNHGKLTGFSAAQLTSAWTTDVPTPLQGDGEFSLTFDGVGNYVLANTANFRSGDSAGTISFWYKNASTGSVLTLFGSGDVGGTSKYLFVQQSDAGYLLVAQRNADTADLIRTSTLKINTGAWVHCCVVSTGSAYLLYVNAVAGDLTVSSGSNTGDWFADTSDLDNVSIAAGVRSSAGGYAPCSIKDVRVYSTALTPAQISELYAGGEATGATPVAQWQFNDGFYGTPADGDPISGYISSDGGRYLFNQPTLPSRPVYEATGVNGLPSLDFDGSDDYIRSTAVTGLLTQQTGTIDIAIRPGSIGSTMIVLSAADEATIEKYVILGILSNGKVYFQVQSGATNNYVYGNTVLVAGDDYTIHVRSDGSAWTMEVNGVAQTLSVGAGSNNGSWFADVTGLDSLVLGAAVLSTGATTFFDGLIAESDLFSTNLSAANSARVRRYYETRYGT